MFLNNNLIVYNLFLRSLRLKGFPIDAAVKAYQQLTALSPDALDAFREEKKWEIFQFHLANNPHYKQRILEMGKESVKDWIELPITKKVDLNHPLSEIISKSFKRKDLHLGKTSGSSGTPLVYAKDKFCHAMTWSKILSSYDQHDLSYGLSYQARFYGMPLEFPDYQKERFKDFLSNRHRFVIHDMSEHILDKYLLYFSRKKFDYVYGYTNSLLLFANYLKEKNVILNTICPSIKKGIVTSEICTAADRLFLQAQFGVPIINEYGASELDLIAFDDADFKWNLNRETLYIEILDEENQPLPPGQIGRIVVTSLFNQAMPFIRYELGDCGALTPDGKSLDRLEGRLNDQVKLKSGKVVPAFTLYYTTKALMNEIDGFIEYKIIQPKIDLIEYYIVCKNTLTESQKATIKKITRNYLDPDLTIIIHQVDSIERTGRGKLKHFESFV